MLLEHQFQEYIKQFEVISIINYRENPKCTHYHFKKRKDMKKSMRMNNNIYDTFSYAGKAWEGKIPTKEMLSKVI